MKGSKLKIILSIVFVAILITGGAVTYIVKSKIKPEEIQKITVAELQKVFPKAKVELGKIDLGLGASITLNAEKFVISYPLRKKSIEIFNVETVSAKIPIWTILLGGGAVDIKIDKPIIRYLDYGKSNLWEMAMKSDGKGHQSAATKKTKTTNEAKSVDSDAKSSSGALLVPAFAANSSINLSLHGIKLEYGKVNALEGKIDINKLVIKNLGLKKDAAYEIDSKILLSESKDQSTSFNTLLIGEFSLKNFLDKGEVRSKALLTLSDMVVPGVNGNFPEIKNDIDLIINKSGDISMKLAGEFDKSNYKMSLDMNKKGINIENLVVSLMLGDLKKILPQQMASLNPGKSKMELDGRVRMVTNKIYPDLSYSLSNKIGLNLPDMSLSLSSQGRITDKKLVMSNSVDLFSGSVDAGIVANYDINSKATDIQKKLKSYILNLDINNLNFDKSYLQKTLYPPKEENKTSSTQAKGKTASNMKEATSAPAKQSAVPLLPGGKINIKAKGINLGGKNMNANGLITTKGNGVKIKDLVFLLDRGEARFNSDIKMFKNEVTKTNFDLRMKGINISSFDGVMPQQYSGSHGLFSGQVKGNAKTGKVLNYDVNVKVNGVNGELKGIDLKPYLEKVYNLAKKIPGLDKKVDPNKRVDYTGNFKRFSLSGQFKPKHYKINSSEFIGLDNLIEAKANGNIYPETKKEGKVFADIVENKYLSNYVEAYAGTRTIPVLFKGPGMTLNADYQYTIKKFSKRLIKKNKSKVKKKAKDKIKKGLDKIFKGKENKKIDKLLKGLF